MSRLRLAAGVATLVLVGTAPVASATTAGEKHSHRSSGYSATVGSPPGARMAPTDNDRSLRKRHRLITMHFRNGRRYFAFAGRVSGARTTVHLLRWSYRWQQWVYYRKMRVHANHHYVFRHLHRVGWYCAFTKPTHRYYRAWSRPDHITH